MSDISARPEKRKPGRPPKSRVDPKFKPTTGGFDAMALLNKDPNKTYCVVDPNVKDSYAQYIGMGYRPEVMTENGVRFRAGSVSQVGETLEARGCILMSVDKQIREEMDREGLENARQRMAEIRRASGIRGIRRDYRVVFEDGDIEADINIPSRETENYG